MIAKGVTPHASGYPRNQSGGINPFTLGRTLPFSRIWASYAAINPQADAIQAALRERGDEPRNDHVAFRTWAHPSCGIDRVAAPFVELGYEARGEYTFEDKHLRARHYELDGQPKVFVSELLVDRLSADAQQIIAGFLPVSDEVDLLDGGRPWALTKRDYETLASESEYAGWLALFGFRVNHFTVDLDSLGSFDSLEALNDFLIAEGYALNDAGGLIKGSPEVFLEQSSTLAAEVTVAVDDGEVAVPGCYYEFIRRYERDGVRFEGFLAANATELFTSTDRR